MANVGLFVFIFLVSAAATSGVLAWILNQDFLGKNAGFAMGFSNTTSPWHVFNWHPFLMTLAYVFCACTAIPAFQLLPTSEHTFKKFWHATFHTLAVISSSLALAAIVSFKDELDIEQFYTAHSWIGIFVFSAYTLNYVLGFSAFVGSRYGCDKQSVGFRLALLPYHKFFGFVIWTGTLMAIVSGLAGRMWIINGQKPAYVENSFYYYFPNMIALTIFLAFMGVVFALFYYPAMKRASEQYQLINTSSEAKSQYQGQYVSQ